MIIWGIDALSHDAAISVVEDNNILFAAHSERYSRVKNDFYLNDGIVSEAMEYGKPDLIMWYEQPWLKKQRQYYSGQYAEAFNPARLPFWHLRKFGLGYVERHSIDHHLSHACAGFLTSPYDEACVLVIDAIGEWDTYTIWKASTTEPWKKLVTEQYPSSLGLLYTAFTQRCGLKPNEEEYILMGMAAWGEPKYYQNIMNDFVDMTGGFSLKQNVHRGIGDYLKDAKLEDIAASIQRVTEHVLDDILAIAHAKTGCDNLVYMGGVALNCVANRMIPRHFKNVWIMPNPGDAGSSLGAAGYAAGGKLNWQGAYLGTDIPGEYPVNEALTRLTNGELIGLAAGRAEFGPRALGNRSLLADPRGDDVKDRVNAIKHRQNFRPFAPAILAEHAEDYFEMPVAESPYMQFTAKVKHPEEFPAICHVDGTSRVQTVTEADNPGFYRLLSEFYNKTGCPMLLNTSLNIKGEPLVNDINHAVAWEKAYGVKVVTPKT